MATAQFRRLHPDSMPTEVKATSPLREVLQRGLQRIPLLPILFRRLWIKLPFQLARKGTLNSFDKCLHLFATYKNIKKANGGRVA